MISLNDVLLAMSNIPVDDPIAEIWGRGLQGGYKIIEYTGSLPITINANGDALIDYRIYGADGGVGVATEIGEPAGYKLPMVAHSKLKDIGDTVLVDGEEWDIVNYNAAHTVATLCKKKVTVHIPMEQKEALFAFPNGLMAGTYHFTMPQTVWYLLPNDSEKNIEFTLINDVPVNGQLFVTPRKSSLLGGTISCYASPTSTTALETATLSEGDGGSSLESPTLIDDPVGNVNNLLCAIMGSPMYKNCSIRQWLNSSSSAGNVWVPVNKFDRPPTWVSTLDGFMHGMDTDFIDAVTATTFTTASGQDKSYQLTDKFVIPSYTEISGVKNYGVIEGEQYQYYTDASADRRKKFDANGVSKSWWLRSIGPYSLASLRFITVNGNYDYRESSSGTPYIAPACKIDLTKLSNSWVQNNMYKSRATTTPVYISENQLDAIGEYRDYVDKSSGKIVRMIGEYTFTGDESFNKYGSSDVFYTSKTIDPVGITTVNTITMRCNHPAFTAIENKDTRYWLNPEADNICCFLPGGRSQVFLRSTSNFTTAAECEAYLKAQFDNGTPVKISYWLKTPVEEDPPVPFPEIPTIDGTTVIDYDGDPKPSQMYVKYKGKG